MHIWCSVIFCLMVSARYVDAAVGASATDCTANGNADCDDTNNEVCDTVTTNKCVCDDGYSETTGTCNPDCADPVAPAHATVALDVADTTDTGAEATVTCATGYEVSTGVATATITCLADGSWDGLPTCSKKDCEAAADPGDGTTTLDSAGVTTYEATATVTCNAGFGLDTDTATATITCQAAGTWSTLPACTTGDAANCGAPSPPDNGAISTPATANTEGYEATVACNTGYALDGASTMTCQHDDTWSTPGTCSDCGAVSDPADGTTELDTAGVMTVGATATVTCDEGFELSTGTETATITCQADASWSTLPTCNAGPISVTWSFCVLLLFGVMTRLMKE